MLQAAALEGLPATRRKSAPDVVLSKADNHLRHVGTRSRHLEEIVTHQTDNHSESGVGTTRSVFTKINVLKPKDIFVSRFCHLQCGSSFCIVKTYCSSHRAHCRTLARGDGATSGQILSQLHVINQTDHLSYFSIYSICFFLCYPQI